MLGARCDVSGRMTRLGAHRCESADVAGRQACEASGRACVAARGLLPQFTCASREASRPPACAGVARRLSAGEVVSEEA